MTSPNSSPETSPRPKSKLGAPLLAASLVLLAGGISFFAAAHNARPVKLTPVEGVAPASSQQEKPQPAAPKAAAPRTPEKAPSEIQWQPSFAAAITAAQTSGKPVMVDFYTDWCGYCKKLDSEVFTDFGVINESVNFVSVKINAEKETELAKKFQVDGFPTIIWITPSGEQLERLPGFIDAPGFIETMRSAHEKANA